MGKIDRNNYEAFFLDYLEGSLDTNMIKELKEFLLLNPDLKGELKDVSDYEKITLPQIEFIHKNKLRVPDTQLKNPVDHNNIDSYLIAYYENDLDEAQSEKMELYLDKYPEFQRLKKIYKNTILQPEKKIVLLNKNVLYQKINSIRNNRVLYFISSVAAVLLFLFLFKTFLKETGSDRNIISEVIESNVSHKKTNSKNKVSDINKVTLKQHIEPSRQVISKTDKKKNTEIISEKTHENVGLQKMNSLKPELLATLSIEIKPVVISQEIGFVEESNIQTGSEYKEMKNRLGFTNPLDYNKDKKIKYWELLKFASSAINKLTVDDLLTLEFTNEGKFSELALKNDVLKITKYSKN